MYHVCMCHGGCCGVVGVGLSVDHRHWDWDSDPPFSWGGGRAGDASMMAPARVNLQDFKARMVKILGQAKEKQYSGLLSSFLSYRLSKAELDRLVPSTIGKENVGLHNDYVRAIINNVMCGQPPAAPAHFSDISKPLKGVRRKPSFAGSDEGPTSVSAGAQGGRSNGDAFGISPRKGRSVIRKGAERPSPLGSHRADAAGAVDDEGGRSTENGHVGGPDLLRPLQSSQQSAEQPEEWQGSHPAKRARHEDGRVQDGKGEGEGEGAGADVEQEEEDEDVGTIWLSSSDVKVPLGIPFCRPSAGGARVAPPAAMPAGPLTLSMLGYALEDDECSGNALPSPAEIQQRVQMGACLDSRLEGCDDESVLVIRAALEMHLQRILEYVVEQSRVKRSSHREGLVKGSGASSHAEKAGFGDDEQAQGSISPLDLYVAMDLDHSKLGMNWSVLLEKILLRAFWDQ
ncbi:hypothetical protein KC19_1G279100 [Ceratodon purpureus]|uniref:Uncharacterized protein n=1 Tax=Ceratodon purpureus TaxID=3225 RepID=A0A8T0JCK0_CERPU|nr:hypothetical protein KC19_1G279100 [Ceratodon purpureus]